MKRFVVGYINFFDNELKLKEVEASDWKEALVSASSLGYEGEYYSSLSSLEVVGDESFNANEQLTCIEIN